jgi:hypothetical protein
MKAQAQTSFSIDCETNGWDPCATLGIINPDRGFFTCVGYATTMRRRCENPIARENRDSVYTLLELLALLSPNSSEFANLLQQVAYRSLCRRNHQNQADSVVRQWKASISALRLPPTRERKATVKGEQSERPTERPQKTGSYYRRYKQEETKPESDSQKQKEQEQTRQRKEQQDRERRKKKQQEQEQKEKEQEQREEEARERMRQKAQQQREERKRQAEEQALRERREWQQAWQSYVTKWAAFKEAKHESSDPRQAQQLIPWPVKSGRFGDLQASSVKTFYRKACPNADTPAMYKTMQAESLKWHPDKLCMLYRTCTPGDADKLIIDMICRVVLELREEAKALRAG